MNAQAHLLSLGWLGPGHALDSRLAPGAVPGTEYKQKGHRGLAYDPATAAAAKNNGNGLVKPILVSQRKNRFGIGKRAHEPPSGTEWWLKGFQSALDNIGKERSTTTTAGTSAEASGTSTPGSATYQGKHVGLYSFFVRGQMIRGTIEPGEVNGGEADEEKKGLKKRKSDVLDNDEETPESVVDSESDRKRRRRDKKGKKEQERKNGLGNGTADVGLAVSPVKKERTAKDFSDAVGFMTERDRSRRKQDARDTQKSDLEQFDQVGLFLGAVAEGDKRNKKKGSRQKKETELQRLALESEEKEYRLRTHKKASEEVGERKEGIEGRTETKEERREKRRRRREQKLAHLEAQLMTELDGKEGAQDEDTASGSKVRSKRKESKEANR